MSMMETERSRRRERRHRVKGLLAVLISLTLLVGGGWFAFNQVESRVSGFFAEAVGQDYEGEGADEVEVTVPSGATATAIGDILLEEDVVASSEAWQAAVTAEGENAAAIQAGRYQLRTQLPAATALDWLLDTERLVVSRVTVPEGLTLAGQLEALSASGIEVEEFEAALEEPAEIGLVPFAEGSAEGFLYPSTYDFDDGTTAAELLADMAGRYADVAEESGYAEAADELGVSERDVATVASLVEREALLDEDRARVARVLYNRLEQGIRLQLDSTVYYATGVYPPEAQPAGAFEPTGEPQSPYNTYKVAGLPPGPIASAGGPSMTAATEPADGDWLYFVTVNFDTGETRFSEDLAEHEANVADWRQWCADNDNPAGC